MVVKDMTYKTNVQNPILIGCQGVDMQDWCTEDVSNWLSWIWHTRLMYRIWF